MKALEALAGAINVLLLAAGIVGAIYAVDLYRQRNCVQILGHWLALERPASLPFCE